MNVSLTDGVLNADYSNSQRYNCAFVPSVSSPIKAISTLASLPAREILNSSAR